MKTPTHLYVCGPMRGIKDFNFPAFALATQWLRDAGYKVTSPAEMECTHERTLERLIEMTPTELLAHLRLALIRDINVICDCDVDGLALLPGWHLSMGAHAEIAVATALGDIKCLSVCEWLTMKQKE